MASSGNFCTYSPINVQGPAGPGTYSPTKGNLGGTTTSGSATWVGTTFGLPSGKWYFEARSTGATSGWPRVGFYSMGAGGDSISSVTSETSNNLSSLRIVHNSGCGVEPFGSTSVTEITGSVSSGDIVQIAIDVDAGKIWYGVNNTYLASGNPATGANAIDDYTAATYNPVMPCVGTYSSQALPDLNFGQDDTFGGAITAAGNADGNGFGVFKYAPPTGFLALCSGNLSVSDDIDPAGEDGETATLTVFVHSNNVPYALLAYISMLDPLIKITADWDKTFVDKTFAGDNIQKFGISTFSNGLPREFINFNLFENLYFLSFTQIKQLLKLYQSLI